MIKKLGKCSVIPQTMFPLITWCSRESFVLCVNSRQLNTPFLDNVSASRNWENGDKYGRRPQSRYSKQLWEALRRFRSKSDYALLVRKKSHHWRERGHHKVQEITSFKGGWAATHPDEKRPRCFPKVYRGTAGNEKTLVSFIAFGRGWVHHKNDLL